MVLVGSAVQKKRGHQRGVARETNFGYDKYHSLLGIPYGGMIGDTVTTFLYCAIEK